MPSAVDIITYIGIPLAVLGVLPTIYTCLKSFLTLRAITRTLHRNGVVALTRSSLLSGIVEIEIPRKSISPLDRHDPEYFASNDTWMGKGRGGGGGKGRSTLRGGGWTAFNWREMSIGVKSYRVQYHDELAQPQAEIEFEALVAFLLDRGAVPSKDGWAGLRSKGLWTPAGTRLLGGPGGEGEVLWVAMSDDSDGILSLGVGWKKGWDSRGMDSLPPYWIRVRAPGARDVDVLGKLEEMEGAKGDGVTAVDKKGGFLDDDSAASDRDVGLKSPVRLRIGTAGIQDAYREDDAKRKLTLTHLRPPPPSSSHEATDGFWFSCAATAFEAPQGGLWSFSIPEDVLALTRQDTVPCGVMVLIGTMTDDEVPTWRTPYDHQTEQFEKQVKFMDQSRRMLEEQRLPPDQRAAARQKRMEQDAIDFHNETRRRRMKEDQRRESEILEALQSQKLPIARVAEKNHEWLLKKFELSMETPILVLVEQTLYGMVQDPPFARRMSIMLDLWRRWGSSGGMTKSHYLAVREDQVIFALASFVFFVIRSMVSEPMGSVAGDLQECLRMWKKVRLG
ncbi:hypothetical protein BCR34DRAFT_580049 [Clohesyomyces aquaticus]|uniref:Uncharacterized protein n=1 Tax=Clohesyomyces aquaticus TaxID=1231657 RepID=A0A1Y1Y970_9PLEO|nr:hypothetical protein BCR34DRAFT_580049 [Clohesyomyces aquaticus]